MARNRKNLKRSTQDIDIENLEKDQIDEFHDQREKIIFGDDGDGDVFDDNDDDEEEVLQLDSEESEESERDSEEEDSEDEENQRSWGAKKSNYFAESDSEIDEQEEEEEALRIQQETLKEMDEADFDQENALVTSEEQIAMLEEKAPELKELVNDFKSKMAELKTNVQPMLEKATGKGLGFLEVKYHLLSSYCINICFYLMLRAQGESVKEHPVIEQLVKLRLYIDKLKPLESKMKYHIDKIIKSQTLENDNLRFRPQPQTLEKEEEQGEEDQKESAVYKPPRIAPMHFEPEKKTPKARPSKRLLRDLATEFNERPEEIKDNDDVFIDAEMEKLQAKLAYEENNFTRLQLSKKELKRLAKPKVNHNLISDLGDFGDLEEEKTEEDLLSMIRKKPLSKYSEQVVKKQKIVDVEGITREEKKKRNEPKVFDDEESFQQFEQESEDEYYEQVKQQKQSYSAAREEQSDEEHFDQAVENDDIEKRPIDYQIMKNKGLTPHRKKENRNPRVKRRARFEKASKKLKTVKAVHSTTAGAYSGEKSGIKTNLSRSVKF